MDDYKQRWKNISDKNYSEGAWSDANISHRMRTLMAMPIFWADYNRPLTYVPYWYDDYYDGTQFEGLTFAKNWSPKGVINDLKSWCNKLSLPSHVYNQAGFHPDGTITHHCGHSASDAAMVAYGYERLTKVNDAIDYFKDTKYPLKDSSYQFLTDHLNYTYRRMIYKNGLNFTVAGRSFFSNLSDFGTKEVCTAISRMEKGESFLTKLEGGTELVQLKNNLKNHTHQFSGTVSFWNADYLVHRNEDNACNYFFSVKHKSVRTAGAEDFDKVRKSWHAGSGVFLLKVDGNEYTKDILAQADWHTLPGVTEEWRSDLMPKGPASASMPGGNEFSGMLTDGVFGLTGYHHSPIDNYTSAEALKSYYLIGRTGTALGSNIKRKNNSVTIEDIVTCVDQSRLSSNLTYMINGRKGIIQPGESVSIKEVLNQPAWIFHNNKGYLIYPMPSQELLIKTGTEINITAKDLNVVESSNYIIAVSHSANPAETKVDGYHYVLIANAVLNKMPILLKEYPENTKTYISTNRYHALYNTNEKLAQVVFYKPGQAVFGNYKINSDQPALIMINDLGDKIRVSLTDPLHNLNTSHITLKMNQLLKEGTYPYTFEGIKRHQGEKAMVSSSSADESTITSCLPDIEDGEFYNYQEQMYAGASVVITLDKK